MEESPCLRWRKIRAEVQIPKNERSLAKVGCRSEESEEESELLEESPCGRWRKMRAEVRIPRNKRSLKTVGV